jgi:membrane-associated phospholipid phosphatase
MNSDRGSSIRESAAMATWLSDRMRASDRSLAGKSPHPMWKSRRLWRPIVETVSVVILGLIPIGAGLNLVFGLAAMLAGTMAIGAMRETTGTAMRVVRLCLSYCVVWDAFLFARGSADAVPWAGATRYQVWRFGRWMGGGELLSARLQRALYHGDSHRFWEYGPLSVYFSFFVVSFLVVLITASMNGQRAAQIVLAEATLFALGLITFYAIPTSPPWLTPDSALNPGSQPATRVYRISALFIGQKTYAFSADRNPNASMPSLHTGVTCLVMLALWRYGPLWRAIGMFYVVAMGFTLLYLGEHYLIDELAGVVLALCAWRIAALLQTIWYPNARARLAASPRYPVNGPVRWAWRKPPCEEDE